MARPKRLRLSRRRGFRLPPNAVNVARPSQWGNPFVVGLDGDRLECVRLYALLMDGYLCISRHKEHVAAQEAVLAHFRRYRDTLKGKDLACWCPVPAPGDLDVCHAAVLLALLNSKRSERKRFADALFKSGTASAAGVR